jgi:hypothetical protein
VTVAELIDLLRGLPQDARVVIPGHEGGVEDALPPQLVRLALDVNRDMLPDVWGPHEVATEELPYADHEIVPAALIEGDEDWGEQRSRRGSCPVWIE